MAQYYSEVLAERTRDGLSKRFEQGCFTGGVASYGYRAVVGPDGRRRYALNEDEAISIRWMADVFLAEPIGMKRLAARLHDKQVPTRKGRRWSFTTVRSILTNRMLIGEIRYKRRKMVLDEESGNRVPRLRAEMDHGVRHDPSLRILPDEVFAEIQAKIKSRARATGATKAVRGIRPFTGHLFCEACGSVCYPRSSNNSKGQYRAYGCGNRQRKGKSACPVSASVREDTLLHALGVACADVLADGDGLIADALELGRQHLDLGRAEANSVSRQIADLNRTAERLAAETVAEGIPGAAKRLIYEQMETVQTQKETLQNRLRGIEIKSLTGGDRLAKTVREEYRRICHDFTQIANFKQWNRFVENFFRPMELRVDGSVGPKTPVAPADAEATVNSNIAGGGFEPPTSGL